MPFLQNSIEQVRIYSRTWGIAFMEVKNIADPHYLCKKN
jgi:hypothetical protein